VQVDTSLFGAPPAELSPPEEERPIDRSVFGAPAEAPSPDQPVIDLLESDSEAVPGQLLPEPDLAGDPSESIQLAQPNEFIGYSAPAQGVELASDPVGDFAASLLPSPSDAAETHAAAAAPAEEPIELASPSDFLNSPELLSTGNAWSPGGAPSTDPTWGAWGAPAAPTAAPAGEPTISLEWDEEPTAPAPARAAPPAAARPAPQAPVAPTRPASPPPASVPPRTPARAPAPPAAPASPWDLQPAPTPAAQASSWDLQPASAPAQPAAPKAQAAPLPEEAFPSIDIEPDLDVIEGEEMPPEPAPVMAARPVSAAPRLVPAPAARPAPVMAADPNTRGGPLSPSFIEGEHKVTVHTVEGQVKRGTVRDVDLMDDAIPLEQQTGFAPELIPVKRMKAVFFMLPAGSRLPPTAGKKLRITFIDGRQVAGFSTNYKGNEPGFFIVPADNRTNIARIFIYRASVRAVAAA
jgi:hypothetical protein